MLKAIPELVAEIRRDLRCIPIEQARHELGSNDGVLIDVRESAEVDANPIPNSLPIPRGVLEMKMSTLYPDADIPLYIHCATGARATLAAEQLRRLGYTHVSVVTCDLETIQACLGCE